MPPMYCNWEVQRTVALMLHRRIASHRGTFAWRVALSCAWGDFDGSARSGDVSCAIAPIDAHPINATVAPRSITQRIGMARTVW